MHAVFLFLILLASAITVSGDTIIPEAATVSKIRVKVRDIWDSPIFGFVVNCDGHYYRMSFHSQIVPTGSRKRRHSARDNPVYIGTDLEYFEKLSSTVKDIKDQRKEHILPDPDFIEVEVTSEQDSYYLEEVIGNLSKGAEPFIRLVFEGPKFLNKVEQVAGGDATR